MDKLDLKNDYIEKGIHMNREQIYVAFRKRLKAMNTILNLKNTESLKKHWLILDSLQKNLKEHPLGCMRII